MLWVGAGFELGGTARAIGPFPGSDEWVAPAGGVVGSCVVINGVCGFDQGCPDCQRWEARSAITKLTTTYASPLPPYTASMSVQPLAGEESNEKHLVTFRVLCEEN